MQTDECSVLRIAGLTALPATAPDVLDRLYATQEKEKLLPQTVIQTDHVIHAGMYARTVTLPPLTKIIGVLIKIPTLVITVGSGFALVGGKWQQVDGYKVLPANANRKQAFVSRGPLIITMLFPTSAKTVEEAEAEFTDELDELLSRRQDANTTVITGE